MQNSSTTNDAWDVEAELLFSGEDGAVVELRLSNALVGRLAPIRIHLEPDAVLSKADYESEALIVMSELASQLESACIRGAVRRGR